MSNALVLGGGAPTLTFQSGALAAMDERGVKIDVISASGAGMLVGLLYAAPKGKSRQQALQDTLHMGVADEIYYEFPINFKVFLKPGLLAQMYRDFLRSCWTPFDIGDPRINRFVNDWCTMLASAWSPSALASSSFGLCAPAPWIEEVVDFDALKQFDGDFFINAYNLTKNAMEIFPKDVITADHFRAALAFPFIYPPYELNGNYYIEGSAIDTLNFEGLFEAEKQPLTILVFDALGSKQLMRRPRDLYDAWVLSIIIPLVEIAKDDLKGFVRDHLPNLRKVDLIEISMEKHVPPNHWPYVLDWSYSNLKTLYELGYEAGVALVEEEAERLFKDLTQADRQPEVVVV